jgi:hypothetical protein
MEITNGTLTSIETEIKGVNRTRLVVIDNEALLIINDENVGPFRLPETLVVGPSSLIVGFEAENPFILDSVFSVSKVRSCEMPGGKFLPAGAPPLPASLQEKNPAYAPGRDGKRGKLSSSGEIRVTGLGVFLKNFRAEVSLTPEISPSATLELGFLFRFAASNRYLRITVDSQGRWVLTKHDLEARLVLDSGEFLATRVSKQGPTRLLLAVKDGRGHILVNSVVEIEFELPEPFEAGDIGVMARVRDKDGTARFVRFRDFKAEKQ